MNLIKINGLDIRKRSLRNKRDIKYNSSIEFDIFGLMCLQKKYYYQPFYIYYKSLKYSIKDNIFVNEYKNIFRKYINKSPIVIIPINLVNNMENNYEDGHSNFLIVNNYNRTFILYEPDWININDTKIFNNIKNKYFDTLTESYYCHSDYDNIYKGSYEGLHISLNLHDIPDDILEYGFCMIVSNIYIDYIFSCKIEFNSERDSFIEDINTINMLFYNSEFFNNNIKIEKDFNIMKYNFIKYYAIELGEELRRQIIINNEKFEQAITIYKIVNNNKQPKEEESSIVNQFIYLL